MDRHAKVKNDQASSVDVYLNGLGLGSIAAAMYLIQKADFNPANIHIFEQMGDKQLVGGSCDASEVMVNGQPAYFMQGSREFEDKAYPCTKELWSIIPYTDDESCLQDHQKNREECRVHTVVRLMHENGEKDTGYQLGLDTAEKLKMAKLMATPESLIPDGAKITDIFGETFFTSNYWYMWRAMFAFQPWHSAVEMKRYMHLFFHEMPNMYSMVALERTRYTNFHSFVLPALRFMQKKGVNVHYDTRISDVDFRVEPGAEQRWIERIHLESASGAPKPSIPVRDTDLVFLTIGSIVSNASFGAHDRPVDRPAVDGEHLGGAWTLWKKIAAKQPDFGRPDRFLRDIPQSTMMSFTVTFRGGLFQRKFEWLVERQMGRQSPLPLTASPWILHLHTYRQPLFPDQPRDACVIWVTALGNEQIGRFVKKTMDRVHRPRNPGRAVGSSAVRPRRGGESRDARHLHLHPLLAALRHQPVSGQGRGRPAGGGAGGFKELRVPRAVRGDSRRHCLHHGIQRAGRDPCRKEVRPAVAGGAAMYFGQHHPLTVVEVARALAR